MEQPVSWKQELMQKYQLQAPYTFNVSKPAKQHNLTQDQPDAEREECAPFRKEDYKTIYNEPGINEFLVKRAKN